MEHSLDSRHIIDVLDNPKVFGIGLERTGTQSLARALEAIGYRVTGPTPIHKHRQIAQRYVMKCVNLSYKFDAFQNTPWPSVYREMHQLWPNAKFVMTTREPDKWLQSITSAFGGQRSPMRRFIYGAPDPLGNEALYLDHKQRHEAEVQSYFSTVPGTLLIMNLEAGDGYDALCSFLKKPVRTENFPFENRR